MNFTSLALDSATMDRVYAMLEQRRKVDRTMTRAAVLREIVAIGLREIEKEFKSAKKRPKGKRESAS
jgi:hypothetical protein